MIVYKDCDSSTTTTTMKSAVTSEWPTAIGRNFTSTTYVLGIKKYTSSGSAS